MQHGKTSGLSVVTSLVLAAVLGACGTIPDTQTPPPPNNGGGNFAAITPDFVAVDSAVQADGKIVLFGLENEHTNVEGYVIARYNANGTPDTAFATNGRFVQATGTANTAIDLTVQPDGKILALGKSGFPKPNPVTNTSEAYVLLRLLPDGRPDPAFTLPDRRPGAIITGDVPNVSSALGVEPDGSILVVGGTQPIASSGSPTSDVALARLLPNGTRDTAFGASGQVTVSFQSFAGTESATSTGTVVRVGPGGKILVGGFQERLFSGQQERVMARLTASGELDASFGTGGRLTQGLSRQMDAQMRAVELLPGGKILVADTGNFMACETLRLNDNGTPDGTYRNGFLDLPGPTVHGRRDMPVSMLVQPDGKIVMGGCMFMGGSPSGPFVVRLNADGTRDTAFGTDGVVTVTDNRSVLRQPSGRLLAGLEPVVQIAP